ncbi:MAG: Ig-like domain-containing protein, partial [Peptococcaceae bacterium]|nr:Ig-like domain-containing protein [Peptococcaceae bacterium]
TVQATSQSVNVGFLTTTPTGTLTSNLPSPQPVGTTVTFTASVPISNAVYAFYLTTPGGTPTCVQPWSAVSTYSLTGNISGTYNIQAFAKDWRDNGNVGTYYTSPVNFTLSLVTLTSISVSPSSVTINGTNAYYGPLTVTAYYSDGSSQNVTGSASWSSSNSGVVYMSGSYLYSGSQTGTATITASYGGKTATCSATVSQPVVLTSISVSPSSATITGTNTYYGTLTVTARYSDNSTMDVTGSASWSSSNSSVAYVSSGSLYSGSTYGTATITASYGGYSATCMATTVANIPPSGFSDFKMLFRKEVD